MKIIKLQAENIKKLKAIEITPQGNVVRITGKNGAGKSSVLDAILYALGGQKAIPDKPIREGQRRASIKLDLEEYTVERRFGKSSQVYVAAKDGSFIKSPQQLLETIADKIAFDPAWFERQDSVTQAALLRKLAGLDLSSLDAEIKELEAKAKQCRAIAKEAAAKVPDERPDAPSELIDIAAMQVDIATAQAVNKQIADANFAVSRIAERVTEAENKIKDLKQEITEWEDALHAHRDAAAQAQQEVGSLGAEIDITALMRQATEAYQSNMAYEDAKRFDTAMKYANKKQEQLESAVQALSKARDKRMEAIASATYPLPELSVNVDGSVQWQGRPFEQASLSERLKASTAIAMKLNPTLRVIRIMDGSLLDSESFQAVADLAKENDYQVWIEQVDETGQVGFYIEEGELAAIDGQPQ